MASDLYVSRGGEKLAAAIVNFQLSIVNCVVLDIGSSTGGFVDCLLQNGASEVYALDTSYGELAWKLRNDPRVVVMERTNILHLKSLPSVIPARHHEVRSTLGVKAGIQKTGNTWIPHQVRDDNDLVDLVTIDAGWTKLELVLSIIKRFLKPGGIIIALLKPHYEASKDQLIKGILPLKIAQQVKDEVIKKIQNLGFKIEDEMESPILGGGGNAEYLLLIK